ncbi:unnamed protein product [Amoebophrya sp. A120]|nr:unnamed protein product [Amoebophrya sp. A120]|eukprot:GSA120T00011744001.1
MNKTIKMKRVCVAFTVFVALAECASPGSPSGGRRAPAPTYYDTDVVASLAHAQSPPVPPTGIFSGGYPSPPGTPTRGTSQGSRPPSLRHRRRTPSQGRLPRGTPPQKDTKGASSSRSPPPRAARLTYGTPPQAPQMTTPDANGRSFRDPPSGPNRRAAQRAADNAGSLELAPVRAAAAFYDSHPDYFLGEVAPLFTGSQFQVPREDLRKCVRKTGNDVFRGWTAFLDRVAEARLEAGLRGCLRLAFHRFWMARLELEWSEELHDFAKTLAHSKLQAKVYKVGDAVALVPAATAPTRAEAKFHDQAVKLDLRLAEPDMTWESVEAVVDVKKLEESGAQLVFDASQPDKHTPFFAKNEPRVFGECEPWLGFIWDPKVRANKFHETFYERAERTLVPKVAGVFREVVRDEYREILGEYPFRSETFLQTWLTENEPENAWPLRHGYGPKTQLTKVALMAFEKTWQMASKTFELRRLRALPFLVRKAYHGRFQRESAVTNEGLREKWQPANLESLHSVWRDHLTNPITLKNRKATLIGAGEDEWYLWDLNAKRHWQHEEGAALMQGSPNHRRKMRDGSACRPQVTDMNLVKMGLDGSLVANRTPELRSTMKISALLRELQAVLSGEKQFVELEMPKLDSDEHQEEERSRVQAAQANRNLVAGAQQNAILATPGAFAAAAGARPLFALPAGLGRA